MGTQKGIIQVRGKVGGLTFYTNHLSKSLPGTFIINHNEERSGASVIIPDSQIEPVKLPKGATHFQIIHALGIVSDFTYRDETKEYLSEEPALDTQGVIQFSPYLTLEDITTSGFTSTVTVPVAMLIPDNVSIIHALGITFFQLVGSVHTRFKQGNAMKIVEIF